MYCFGELKKIYLNFSNALRHLTTHSHICLFISSRFFSFTLSRILLICSRISHYFKESLKYFANLCTPTGY